MKKLFSICLLSIFLLGCSNQKSWVLEDDNGKVRMKVIYEGDSTEDPNYVVISRECWDDKGNEIDCEDRHNPKYWEGHIPNE
jgi:hypothetical protein